MTEKEKDWCEKYDALEKLGRNEDLLDRARDLFLHVRAAEEFRFETSVNVVFIVKALPGKRMIVKKINNADSRADYYCLLHRKESNSNFNGLLSRGELERITDASQYFAEKMLKKYQKMQEEIKNLKRTLEA